MLIVINIQVTKVRFFLLAKEYKVSTLALDRGHEMCVKQWPRALSEVESASGEALLLWKCGRLYCNGSSGWCFTNRSSLDRSIS